MPRFVKKPIEIEAFQLTGGNRETLISWVNDYGGDAYTSDDDVMISTLEGVMRANYGDWIIKGVKGEFYPCQHEIFVASYSPVKSECVDERADVEFNSSGSKYLRKVQLVAGDRVDVYAVLDAFEVTCPARQHAIKKLLCCGLRGKGDASQDLREAADAVERAVQLQQAREV